MHAIGPVYLQHSSCARAVGFLPCGSLDDFKRRVRFSCTRFCRVLEQSDIWASRAGIIQWCAYTAVFSKCIALNEWRQSTPRTLFMRNTHCSTIPVLATLAKKPLAHKSCITDMTQTYRDKYLPVAIIVFLVGVPFASFRQPASFSTTLVQAQIHTVRRKASHQHDKMGGSSRQL